MRRAKAPSVSTLRYIAYAIAGAASAVILIGGLLLIVYVANHP